MKILYFGKEQTGGFIETIFTVQGGYVATINDDYIEYVDWTSFDFVKTLTDDEVEIGLPNTMRHYNEYWTRDDDPSITSTTWKLTKVIDGQKQPDVEGYTWSKVKANWTDQEMTAIVGFDKKWLEGKIASLAKSTYARINVDRGTVEKETWDLQLAQAKEYKETGSAGILLSGLASARGDTVSSFADTVIRKNNEYQTKVERILGLQLRLRKELGRCNTVREVQLFAQKYTDLIFDRDVDITPTPIHELFRNIT